VLFNKDQTILAEYPAGRTGNYVVPEKVTRISYSSFQSCPFLSGVTMPESVQRIDSWAFLGCTALTNLVLPRTLAGIGSATFASCTNLTQVSIPDGVTYLGEEAFSRCGGLLQAEIGSGLADVADYAFYECTSLANIVFGSKVSRIGYQTFRGCTNLTQVTIPDNVRVIEASAFDSCSNLTEVTVGSGVKDVGDRSFGYCPNLTSVRFKGNPPVFPGPAHVFYWTDHAIIYFLPGTTGWGATFAERPTAHWFLPFPTILTDAATFGLTSSQFGFVISWATNASIAVEACTDLSNPVWSSIYTNTLDEGAAYFRDAAWTNYTRRFYRVRSE
jgi:hypothetical protein